MYKETIIAILFGLATSIARADSDIPDPEEWYSDSYAQLWVENPGSMLEAVVNYYDTTVVYHAASGEITRNNGREWLAFLIEGWIADGWVGSDLTGLKMDRLNGSTATFKTQWRDRYSDSPDEFSCAWYMANIRNGKWVFTNYAEMDCAAHGF